jgi:threonine aldolase
MAAMAKRRGIATHLDGARIFNAALALGVDVTDLTADVDSVMFCLSKGLAAPVGSVLCGSSGFINEARRNRRMVGGQMRQAGVLAAAGIVALDEMVDRLIDDHRNARYLAEEMSQIDGVTVELERVQTNIVMFGLTNRASSPAVFVGSLEKRGVRLGYAGRGRFRAVTHYGVEQSDIDVALVGIRNVIRELQ